MTSLNNKGSSDPAEYELCQENLYKDVYDDSNVEFSSDVKLLGRSSPEKGFKLKLLSLSLTKRSIICFVLGLSFSLLVFEVLFRVNLLGRGINKDSLTYEAKFDQTTNQSCVENGSYNIGDVPVVGICDPLTVPMVDEILIKDKTLLKLATENHQDRADIHLGISDDYVKVNTHGERLKIRRQNMEALDKVRIDYCGPISPKYLSILKSFNGKTKVSSWFKSSRWKPHVTMHHRRRNQGVDKEEITRLKLLYKNSSESYARNKLSGEVETYRSICESSHPTIQNAKVSVERLGPFTSQGGYDWNTVNYFVDAWNLKSTFRKQTVSVLGTFFSPVHANGSIITYPPLHVHHAHIYPYGHMEDRVKISLKDAEVPSSHHVLIQTHGDGECKESQGGTDCLLHQLPDNQGYRVVNSSGFHGNFEINDVRKAGSKPLEFFIDVVLIWTNKKRIETTFMQMGNPPLGKGWMTYLFPLDPNSNFIYYKHRNTVLGSGTISNFIMHTHMSYTDSVYIFKGDQVFSQLEKYRKIKNTSIPYVFDCHNETLASGKKEILGLILATKAELVCEATKPSMDLFCEVHENGHGVIWDNINKPVQSCIYRDKRFDLNCKEQVRLNKGDTLTVVAFNHVRNTSTVPLTRRSSLNNLAIASNFGEGYVAHQHTFFRADFVSDLARDGQLKDSTGSASRDIEIDAYAPPAQFHYAGWPIAELLGKYGGSNYDRKWSHLKSEMIKNCSIPMNYNVNLPWETLK